MMVKVLLYGYASGTFSSRKLARKLHEDVAFRVLAAGNFPVHRTLSDFTLSDFRASHLGELSELFVQVVRLARECGLVELGTAAIDGTKVKANASRHEAMSYKRMRESEQKLAAQIREPMDRAKAAGAAERDEPELDIPAESPVARSVWRRSGRRRRGSRRVSARRTGQPVDTRTTRASRPVPMANPGGGRATSASSVCRRTRRRRASPPPTAAS